MSRKNSITTRVGDHGTTFLFSGEEVPKDSLRTDAYGDLDELVSVLGLARVHAAKQETKDAVIALQRDLFIAGSELATSREHIGSLAQRIDPAALERFEKRRDDLEGQIEMPKGFILPGGTPGGAYLDHARTIARRLERKAVSLHRAGETSNENLLVWLNRVSDFLWLLARFEEGPAVTPK